MGRWERLAETISEITPVQAPDPGESRQILIRAGQTLIVIHDTWWPKNIDVWTGWEVYVEGPDSIVTRTYPKTKKRGDVRRHVEEALAAAASPVDR